MRKIPKQTLIGRFVRRMIPEYIIDLHKDEKKIMSLVSDDVTRTISALKIPMVEAISSVILMIISLWFLNFEFPAFLIVIFLIILLLVSFVMVPIIYIGITLRQNHFWKNTSLKNKWQRK